MLTLLRCHHINKMKEELKYIQTLKVAQKKESSIIKIMQEQQQTIWYKVYLCSKALDKPIIIDNFDNEVVFK